MICLIFLLQNYKFCIVLSGIANAAQLSYLRIIEKKDFSSSYSH